MRADICWCGHNWNSHLTQVDKPNNNCDECRCKDWHENGIITWFQDYWEISVISICFGILAGAFTWASMSK